ncbi:hypothetical protein QN277_002432 [Acacia crassicarpa]|uniref:Retrotransposon Copia-like N-terminal domain-containing protein n=1 Tax=Acacia crassicarpa TaxID=499986 RepID=A0AAE1THW8_9FABA|nr:hypothetical protein QN277_002432 [Acacia crassicarpa]
MGITLHGKHKLGFIDGSCLKESQDASLHEHWERCNAVVLSWIVNSISKHLANSVIFYQDTRLVWNDLKERFDKVTAEAPTIPYGTQEHFSGARSQILLISPLPSVNQAFAVVAEDEAQKLLADSSKSGHVDGIAMTARGRGCDRGRGRSGTAMTCAHCRKKSHQGGVLAA